MFGSFPKTRWKNDDEREDYRSYMCVASSKLLLLPKTWVFPFTTIEALYCFFFQTIPCGRVDTTLASFDFLFSDGTFLVWYSVEIVLECAMWKQKNLLDVYGNSVFLNSSKQWSTNDETLYSTNVKLQIKPIQPCY